MSKRPRSKSTTVSEKTNEIRQKRMRLKAQTDALTEEGFEILDGSTKFAHKWHERTRSAATLTFQARDSKTSIYLKQKPIDQLLHILRRRGEEKPNLARAVRPRKATLQQRTPVDPDALAKSRILLTLAVKIRIIANGRTDVDNNPLAYRRAIQDTIMELARELGPMKSSGVLMVQEILTNMVFSIEDETELRDHLRQTLVSIGEVLVCDEKLWFHSGEAGGWVRLVISKPDRVGHWFYTAVVKLANGRFYCVYYRLHRVPNKLANQAGTLPVDVIGADWIQIFRQSDPEIAEPFIIADGYYMSEAMRERIKSEKVAAIIAMPPDRWKSVISLLQPKLKAAGDSASLYNEVTDEVQHFRIF